MFLSVVEIAVLKHVGVDLLYLQIEKFHSRLGTLRVVARFLKSVTPEFFVVDRSCP
jgi:hypothetical protein